MSKLLKNSFFYTIGNFTTKAINFLLLPLYTQYLSPSEYGIVNSMQVFSDIILIFFTLGLERSIYRLYHDFDTEEGQKDFLGTVAISIAIVSLFGVGCLFLFHRPIGSIFNSIEFHPFFTFSIFNTLFVTYELVPKISFQVKEQANKFLVLSLVILGFRVLPVVWWVVFLKEGAIGMLKGSMIGNAATLIFLIPITLSQINFQVNTTILKNTLKYCLPIIPITISSWVVNMSDRIFIERYFSTYDVGIYSLGYKIGQLVQVLSVSILMAYNPYFYRLANSKNQVKAKEKLFVVNNVSVIFLMFIGFLVAFFSKDIIILFFSEKYKEAYKIIPIIVLGYFFAQLVSLQSLSFHQEKKTLTLMNINFVSALINIGLNFMLISRYGYLGAAISTVFTQFVYFIIVYFFSKRYYFISYKFSVLIFLLLFFLLLFFLSNSFLSINIWIFVAKVFCAIILTLFLFIFLRKYLQNV